MPEVSPWRWVPESALPQVARRFDDLLQPWARSWGLALGMGGQATLATADTLARSLPPAQGTWTRLAGEGGPWVRLPPTLGDDLAAGMFGQDAARSQLIPEVARRALQSLQSHLQHELGGQAEAPAMPLPTPSLGHWGVCYELGLGPHGLGLLATSGWLVRQGWIERPVPAPLEAHAWAKTLADLPVSLRVDLGEAAVPVGELFNLGEGDVILMTQTIAQALPVHVLGTEVQLRAHLGQADARRAVQFISTTTP